jgi:hypothetical protein
VSIGLAGKGGGKPPPKALIGAPLSSCVIVRILFLFHFFVVLGACSLPLLKID